MAGNDEIPIPRDAEKILFAEDLVNFVFSNAYTTDANRRRSVVKRAEPFRHLIHNGFNVPVMKAIQIIDEYQDSVNIVRTVDMKDEDRKNLGTLTEYAKNFKARHLSDGFEATYFLMYCARIAYLSGYFLQRGIAEAAEKAVDLIVSGFPDGDMSRALWGSLNDAAEIYISAENDIQNNLTASESSLEHTHDEDTSSGNDM